jgi:hypothetical protein
MGRTERLAAVSAVVAVASFFDVHHAIAPRALSLIGG